MRKLIVAIFFGIMMSGCSATTVPVTYEASNTQKTEATLSIKDVVYNPAKNGEVAPNEVENEAIGQIFLGENIADLVQRANTLEFRYSGGEVDPDSDISVKIYIQRFFAGDFGYRVRWEYEANYVLYKNNDPVHNKEVVLEPIRTSKFNEASDYEPTVENMVRQGYEEFISDSEVQDILNI